jgi:soluble lytic murein transglycosylase-like protein
MPMQDTLNTRVTLSLLSALLALALAAPAKAHVLEIGDDGGVTVFDKAPPRIAKPARIAAPRVVVRRAATAPAPVRVRLESAGQRYDVSPALLDAVAWQESRYRQDAVSRVGARGVMQLMPGTARDLGVNPHDKTQNIYGGAAYLRAMLNRYNGNVDLALAAYNAGPGRVDRARGIPAIPETQAYVRSILERMASQSLAELSPAQ